MRDFCPLDSANPFEYVIETKVNYTLFIQLFMNTRLCLMFASLFFGCASLSAAVRWTAEGNDVVFHSKAGDMRVQVCTSDMLRITKSINSSFRPNEKWMVVNYDFEAVPYEVQPLAQGAALLTEALTLQVYDSPWRVRVIDRATGEVLYEETDCRLAAEDAGSASI